MNGENLPLLLIVIAIAIVYIIMRTMSGAGRTTYEDRKAVQDMAKTLVQIEQRLDTLEQRMAAQEQRK